MSNINFEEDQQNIIDNTDDLDSLAVQVKTLQSLENEIIEDEKSLKDKFVVLEKITLKIAKRTLYFLKKINYLGLLIFTLLETIILCMKLLYVSMLFVLTRKRGNSK